MLRDWLLEPYASQFMRNALVMAVVVGVLAPTVGVWVVLRRVAYLGDAMSHGTLAGVAAAYALGVGITVGALAAGLVMGMMVALLDGRRRISQDSAIGVVETLMFGLGVVLLSLERGVAIDLTHYLFGQIVTVDRRDIVVNGSLTVLALGLVAVFYPDLRAVTFDPGHARQVGIPVTAVKILLMLLISVSVVVSLDTVGLLMSVAMLVTPAATARLVTTRVETMTALAAGIGVGSAVTGLTLSYHLSSPPGPTIALVAAAVFLIVLLVTETRRRHPSPSAPAPSLGAAQAAVPGER